MIELIRNSVSLPQSLFLDALLLMVSAVVIALIISQTIKWTLLWGAKAKQRPILAFVFQAIRLPISLTIVLLGIHQAANLFDLSDWLINITPKILQSIDIVIWGQFVFRSTRFALKYLSLNAKEGAFIRVQTLPLFENGASVIIVLIGMYLLFISWNIDMTAWLASAGVIGIAVGFAAKDTISNLLSGVFILADSPYKIGDYIVIDSGERGMVTHIGLRSTRILTRDDLEINVPNAIIANGKIINESSGRHIKSRTRIAVSVSYQTDIDMAKQALLEIAAEEAEICSDPEPRVRFRRFGASGLDLELLVWIDDPEIRGRVIDSLNTAIYKGFAERHIEIPYSKHDVYIKSMPMTDSEQ